MIYLDFDLHIEPTQQAGEYRARVLDSPMGQAERIFILPFDEKDLRIFVLSVGRARRGVRRLDSKEMRLAREFGSQLYRAVFQDQLQACLLRCLDETDKHGNGLRIRLRLDPSLINLPWEYLYDTVHSRFFSHSVSTPIVRFLEITRRSETLTVTLPLKVLVMIASANDYPPLDIEQEWQRVKIAVSHLEQRGLIELTRLEAGTLAALQRKLRKEQFHIFHFIGHGGFDEQNQEGILLLEDENQWGRRISGHHLGTILHDHRSLRLALLNACEGARTAAADPFAGVAQHLVLQGLPAVIAMQFEITDAASILLAREFYEALADGYAVDAALAEARKAIFASGNDVEWGTPVLYMRSTDKRLFELEQSGKVPELQSEKRAESSDVPFFAVAQAKPATRHSPPARPAPVRPTAKIDFDWVLIPAGEFLMGSNKAKDKDAADYELPQHKLYLPEYKIARMPLTVMQFEQFIDATGYITTAEEKGSAWGHDGEEWTDIRWAMWASPRGGSNYSKVKSQHPVTCVSWRDAQAFCQWAGVQLPSEAEWERAARGKDGQIYPWGNEAPDSSRCNFNMGVGDTTPVGNYPKGASPEGLLDMVGNVKEWTSSLWGRSLWRKDFNKPDFGYPYKVDDGRENLAAPDEIRRVVRGGSFDRRDVRCAYRFGLNPLDVEFSLGFRVVSPGC